MRFSCNNFNLHDLKDIWSVFLFCNQNTLSYTKNKNKKSLKFINNFIVLKPQDGYFPSTNEMHCSAVNQPITSIHVYKYMVKLEKVTPKAIISQFHNTPDPRIIAADSGLPLKIDLKLLKKLCDGSCKNGLLYFSIN